MLRSYIVTYFFDGKRGKNAFEAASKQILEAYIKAHYPRYTDINIKPLGCITGRQENVIQVDFKGNMYNLFRAIE